MDQLLQFLDFFGVAVFAITGSLAAGRKQMDLFGMIVLASVTALGGGTIRDVLLSGRPVFWIISPVYLMIAGTASIITCIFLNIIRFLGRLLLIADAIGLAVFTVLGTEKAMLHSNSAIIAMVMGMLTGVSGGIVRDILSGEIPLILRREIYATACLCGALVYWLSATYLEQKEFALIVSIAVTLILRLAACFWELSLPGSGIRQTGL